MMSLPVDWMTLAQTAPVPAEESVGAAGWVLLASIAGIFIVPFVLGALIARVLKLSDLSFKIGLVLFTTCLGLAPFAWQIAHGQPWTAALRPGIDLAGGTNLVFQVNFDAAEKEFQDRSQVMDQMIGAVARRLDPAAQEQITVRRVGADRIEVIIPGADREVVERKKNLMTRLGSLEFAILANRRDHADIIRDAQDVTRDLRRGGRVIATWRDAGVDAKGNRKDVGSEEEVAVREVEREGQQVPEFLVILEPEAQRVTGKYLTRAYETTDENGARVVGFTFNQRGGFLFQRLTSENRPGRDGFHRRLAILLDGKIHSAPVLQDVISDQGVIRGQFTSEEIAELINVLNAGALEVPIDPNPISEATISPLLGIDVQTKGMRAIIWSGVAVFGFMLIYYRFCGVAADICLLLNLILLMGCMALIDASLTLPGLAGIVLTIGMNVDANVLIYERMREEQARGSSLRISIQNGFDRALSAIIDTNVTTLISAVVLYMIGTDQIRGFAVTLFIGIVLSLYTALAVCRLIFDIVERKRWVQRLSMMSFVGTTHWKFINKQKIAFVISAATILIGLGTLYARGRENLDIEFTGGTMVTFEFVEPEQIDEIRGILQQKLGTAITLEQLTLATEERSADGRGKRFRLRTSQSDIDAVRQAVNEALVDHELRKVTLQYGDLAPIQAAAANANGTAQPTETAETAAAPDGAAPADGATGTAADAGNQSPAGEGAEPAADGAADPLAEFEGGRKVNLTFSGEIPVATAEDYLAQEIVKLTGAEGKPRFDEPSSLFVVTGTAGSGLTAERGQVQRFSEMELQVSPALSPDELKVVLDATQAAMAANPIFDEINSFDASIAGEMQQSAILALLASMTAIVIYLWFRFQRASFGLACIAAVVHDIFFVIGAVAVASYLSPTIFGQLLDFEDFKINMSMVAAFMTIVGYSLNDTIVVFDRVREVRGKNPALTEEMIDLSLNQTLSRTILTSLTVLMVVLILYALGGEGIHGFAYCLVVGTLVGTYSTIYIAAPVLLWLMNRPGAVAARGA